MSTNNSPFNTIPTRGPAVLRFVNKHPVAAWSLLAAVVAGAALLCAMPGEW